MTPATIIQVLPVIALLWRLTIIILGVALIWGLRRSRRFRVVFVVTLVAAVSGYFLKSHIGPQPNIKVLGIKGHQCWSQEGFRDPGTPDDRAQATGLPYCWD